jgi:2-oxoglutarate ferredoxin oxidoreductase subunit delta
MMNVMIIKEKETPIINRDWCKGCSICVHFCPNDALVLDEVEKARLVYPERCNGCGFCELRCPDLAIEFN